MEKIMVLLKEEKVSAYTHGALIPVMAAGTVILLIIAGNNLSLQIVSLVYGLSAVTLFTASYLYHSKKRFPGEKSIWRRLDHSAIYILIAGTYTPMCFLYLEGWMMKGILIAQWSLVLSGIFLSFFSNAPRILSTAIYLLMGWVVIIPFKSLIEAMPLSIIILLVSGGLSYTIGALIYAFKKPDPFPPYMGFHEIFHICVILGAGFHLAMIITGVGTSA